MPFSIKFVGKNSINESLGEIISDGLDETIVIPTDLYVRETVEGGYREGLSLRGRYSIYAPDPLCMTLRVLIISNAGLFIR